MKILITGAASGIGRACADLYRVKGAELVLVDRQAGDGIVTGDVADPDFWEALDLAGLTHAIVNAGISDSGPIVETALDQWRRVMDVNLDGSFLTLRAALRAIDKGGIVVTASVTGLKPIANTAAYGASKAALIHLAKVAAAKHAARGVRVNVIAPSGVDTAMWNGPMLDELIAACGSREEAMARLGADTPIGRFSTPAEIARQVAMLLEEESLTGAVLVGDGGFSL